MSPLSKPLVPLLWCCLPVSLAAQGFPPLAPFSATRDVFVTDSGDDKVWRLADLNFDGDSNDPGELIQFYSDTLGGFALSNNNGIAVGPSGAVFVSDSSQDNVYRMLDLNGDGDANDAGETAVYFNGNSGGNASGVVMAAAANLSVDAVGRVWVASASSASGTKDAILRLFDANGDGDANDLGEASEYFVPAPGGASSDSIPQDVLIGLDTFVYYLETGSTGVLAKGVYRLVDSNGSGSIEAGESVPWFVPPTLSETPFYWGIAIDLDGWFYMADSGNELIWRFRDGNGDGFVDPTSEASVYWQAPLDTTLIFRAVPGSDGSLLCAESEDPDRILWMRDLDGSGSIDPVLEVSEWYSEFSSMSTIGNPRSIVWARRPSLIGSAAPALGTSTSYLTLATQGDFVFCWFSSASSAPILVPPFGEFELSLAPSDVFGPFYNAVVPATGVHVLSLSVPSDPQLVGQTLFLQSLVGSPARLQTTALFSQTVFP